MKNIRDIRKQLGLAIDVLAYKAGVSVRHLVLWERYGLPPRKRETVEKIARVLGVDPDELLPADSVNAEEVEVGGVSGE